MLTFENIMAMCELQGHVMELTPTLLFDTDYTCRNGCGYELWLYSERGVYGGYAPLITCAPVSTSDNVTTEQYTAFVDAQRGM